MVMSTTDRHAERTIQSATEGHAKADELVREGFKDAFKNGGVTWKTSVNVARAANIRRIITLQMKLVAKIADEENKRIQKLMNG